MCNAPADEGGRQILSEARSPEDVRLRAAHDSWTVPGVKGVRLERIGMMKIAGLRARIWRTFWPFRWLSFGGLFFGMRL